MPDPSRLVTIHSFDDPTTAPTGSSAPYVLEPVPDLDCKIIAHQLPIFFAGSGTVPGLGVPRVIISGKLAASRVVTYLRKQGR